LPELRPRVLEAVDLHTAKADRAVVHTCEAIAAARAANDEPRALDLTTSAWDDFHTENEALRPRAFGAVADAVVPRILPDVSRVDALFVEIRRATLSPSAEKLAREWLGAWVRARAGTIANAILAPIVDGALDAARNREVVVLGRCAPRTAPKPAPKAPAKPSAGNGASDQTQ
jgi:hypothetical protein